MVLPEDSVVIYIKETTHEMLHVERPYLGHIIKTLLLSPVTNLCQWVPNYVTQNICWYTKSIGGH
jgi:hypothetical protein